MAEAEGTANAPPPARRRRSGAIPIAFLIVVLVAYVGLLYLYAVSGRTTSLGDDATPPPGGVVVDVRIAGVDAPAQHLTVDVDLLTDDPALVASNGLVLAQPITVVIDPSAGEREITFPAGQVPPVNRFVLDMSGDIRNWPLDRYSVDVAVGVFEGTSTAGRPIPRALHVDGRVQGWQIAVKQGTGFAESLGFADFFVEAGRSGSTLAFGFILLAVMATLPVVALFVAVNTLWRRRRAVQGTLMSWMAAMLFATLPLRGFLPGSPPPGSWIDAVLVLWVIVGLVGALVIYAVAWYRQSAPH